MMVISLMWSCVQWPLCLKLCFECVNSSFHHSLELPAYEALWGRSETAEAGRKVEDKQRYETRHEIIPTAEETPENLCRWELVWRITPSEVGNNHFSGIKYSVPEVFIITPSTYIHLRGIFSWYDTHSDCRIFQWTAKSFFFYRQEFLEGISFPGISGEFPLVNFPFDEFLSCSRECRLHIYICSQKAPTEFWLVNAFPFLRLRIESQI